MSSFGRLVGKRVSSQSRIRPHFLSRGRERNLSSTIREQSLEKKGPPLLWNVHRLSKSKGCVFTGMEVVFLGTSAGGSQAGRNSTSVAVRACGHSQQGSHLWLFDCGEGTYRQLQNSTLSHSQVQRIFVSHMHGDHIWGLASVISANLSERSIDSPPMTLHIYGPVGLYAILSCILEISQVGLPRNTSVAITELEGLDEWHQNELEKKVPGCGHRRNKFRLDAWAKTALNTMEYRDKITLHSLPRDTNGAWTVYEDEWNIVQCAPLRHTVPCVGYAITEKPRKLKIHVEKAIKAGLPPGRAYKTLQQGEDVTLNDGTIIRATDVTIPPDPPRKVVICGDTAKPTSEFAHIAKNADIFVHEATLSDFEMDKAIVRGHSTPGMAGSFARSIQAKWLVLTHFSARYIPSPQRYDALKPGLLDDQTNTTIDVLLKQAISSFASKNVLAAHDFMALSIPRAGCSADDSSFNHDHQQMQHQDQSNFSNRRQKSYSSPPPSKQRHSSPSSSRR